MQFSHGGALHDLDVVPFGAIAAADGQIRWPPGYSHVMVVDSLDEAARSTVLLDLGDRLHIPVVDLPGLSILKLFAWRDRGLENDKDAQDFMLLLANYGRPVCEERLYTMEGELLERFGGDLTPAGAFLLGRDVAEFTSQRTRDQLVALVTREPTRDRLLTDFLRHRSPFDQERAHEELGVLLDCFVEGLAFVSTT